MSERILRFPAVRERTGMPKTLVYDGMKKGSFPSCIKLDDTGRAVGWLESEIDAWIKKRVGQRQVRGFINGSA